MSIKRVIAVTALAAAVLTATACTSTPATSQPTAVAHRVLTDPLTLFRNPYSAYYVSKDVVPLLHVEGRGTKTFSVTRPTDPKAGIEFMISCTPGAHYRVTMGSFFAGECDLAGSGTATVPAMYWAGSATPTVTVHVTAKTSYWLVAIDSEDAQ